MLKLLFQGGTHISGLFMIQFHLFENCLTVDKFIFLNVINDSFRSDGGVVMVPIYLFKSNSMCCI